MIAFVTIGQSPRNDMVPEVIAAMGDEVEHIQIGALDHLDTDAIRWLGPEPGERLLITKLRSGETVKVSEERLFPLMQRAVSEAAERAQVVLLLCTGSFSRLACSVPLICPDSTLMQVALALLPGGHLGVITPDVHQVGQQYQRWSNAANTVRGRRSGVTVKVGAASPYEATGVPVEAALEDAAAGLADCGLIVLDCMGYTQAMKALVRAATGKPVVLARSLMGRVAAEIVR